MQTDLQPLLNHLTDIQRRRIYLRYYRNPPMSITEIAESEGVSKAAICKAIKYAIKKLKKLGWIVS